MRKLAALLLLFTLAGCIEHQKQQVTACYLEAMRTSPGVPLEVDNSVETSILTCMAAEGYEWNLDDKRCDVSTTMAKNPYCYVPSAWMARLGYTLETLLGWN